MTRRAVEGQRGGQHALQFGLVLGHEDGQPRDYAQEGKVEGSVMRRPVLAHQAGPVDREHDGQTLQADVLDHLIEGALQERSSRWPLSAACP